jgi:hypothetical protein
MIGRRVPLVVFLAVVWVPGLTLPALADLPNDLQAGTRVKVHGRLVGPRSMRAEQIEIHTEPGGEDELTAVLEKIDAPGKALVAAGIRITTSDKTALEDAGGKPIALRDLKQGQWIGVDGTLGEDGVLSAHEVSIKGAKPGRQTKFEGRVQRVDAARNTFGLLGATVTVTPQTEITRRAGERGASE